MRTSGTSARLLVSFSAMDRSKFAPGGLVGLGVPCLILAVTVYALSCLAQSPDAEASLYGEYDRILAAYVDSQGRVDYASLKENRGQLDGFVEQLGQVDLDSWNPAARIAFWINAYNALTLRVIIDNYPIRSSFLTSLAYPRNSIRQIDGAWDGIHFGVAERDLTLDQIEHSILRRKFDEPRIHVALVCAAVSCPMLRREAYRGRVLENQLQDQAAQFVRDPSNFRLDTEAGVVYMSSILKWFGSDFKSRYTGTPETFSRHSAALGAVLNFALPFLEEEERQYLKTQRYRVKYLSYDWTLNEQ